MPKRKTKQEREGEEDEKFDRTDARNANDEGDGGDEEEQEQPEPKKSKSDAKPKVNKSAGKKMGDGSGVSNKIELGKNKFVDVREFKGMVLIDIREYYEAAGGEMKPGKKGIALNSEQWKVLKESMDDITSKIEELQ